MFIPVGDIPNSQKWPVVNILLILINAAVFVAITLPLSGKGVSPTDPVLLEYMRALAPSLGQLNAGELAKHLSAYDLFVFQWGFKPSDPQARDLFVAMFLHAGWLHFLGNMLFLWIFGDNVEHRMGRVLYLLTYLATGAAATLFFAAFVTGSSAPLIGASGAISGVLGLYFAWFPHNRVKTFIFLFPIVMQTIQVPARFMLGFYLLVDNLLPFVASGPRDSGVAHGAHIGGFMAGLAIGWSIKVLQRKGVGHG